MHPKHELRDQIAELRIQLCEAQRLVEVSAETYPEQVLARLVTNVIRREIEALEAREASMSFFDK